MLAYLFPPLKTAYFTGSFSCGLPPCLQPLILALLPIPVRSFPLNFIGVVFWVSSALGVCSIEVYGDERWKHGKTIQRRWM